MTCHLRRLVRWLPLNFYNMAIKTYKKWEKSEKDFDEYVKPMDEVDEEMFMYYLEILPPQFTLRHCKLFQSCEAIRDEEGCVIYDTFQEIEGRFFYLGQLPEFKQPEERY